MMAFFDFLDSVINEGIEAVKADYCKPEDKSRLEGSIEGFEACRNKMPAELWSLLDAARKKTMDAFLEQIPTDDYWRIRSREAEIEWVCNVASAAMVNGGMTPIVEPTARGMMQAVKVLSGGALILSDEVPA